MPHKVLPVIIVPEKQSPLDSSADDVMQCTRGINACFSWHEVRLP